MNRLELIFSPDGSGNPIEYPKFKPPGQHVQAGGVRLWEITEDESISTIGNAYDLDFWNIATARNRDFAFSRTLNKWITPEGIFSSFSDRYQQYISVSKFENEALRPVALNLQLTKAIARVQLDSYRKTLPAWIQDALRSPYAGGKERLFFILARPTFRNWAIGGKAVVAAPYGPDVAKESVRLEVRLKSPASILQVFSG